MAVREQERWIDAWKGGLIILVVVGHVVGALSHQVDGAERTFLRAVYFLIYSFHMPAFFFVSGWLWHEQPFGRFFVKRVRRLVVPYFAVGVVSILLYALVGDVSAMATGETDGYYRLFAQQTNGIAANLLSLLHGGGWPKGEGFRYNSVLWFLPCLFCVQMYFYAIERLLSRWRWVLFGVALGAAFSWAVFRSSLLMLPWGAGLAVRYLPFCILGYLLSRSRWRDLTCVPWPVVGGSLILYLGFTRLLVENLCTDTPAYFAAEFFAALFGILAGMTLLKKVQILSEARGLQFLGVSSMAIMLWHKFVISGAQVKLSWLMAYGRQNFALLLVLASGLVVSSIVFALALSRFWIWIVARARRVVDAWQVVLRRMD